ncbi:MAG: right-handed parallel beta-helix repeat-containing protein [Candidatus Hydrogenedentes bacterium]|nr:right-handed parallel beta-helix repeat-containing protein [Candidatus Hydrogenedentota bacterium]
MFHSLACLLIGAASAALELHVAPNGLDSNPGTEAAPLATLTRARDVLREARATGGLPADGAIVWVQDGDYAFTQSLSLSAEDSGTAEGPIVYRADHNGGALLHGGRVLPAAHFAAVTDPAVRARIPREAQAPVRQIDLRAEGMTDFGVFPEAFEGAPPLPELFYNNQRMALAGWPNEGWAEIDAVVESGPAPWRNHVSDKLGVFRYAGDRPANWKDPASVYVEGYWCFDWSCETVRVQAIDPVKREITLAKQHVYGIGSGNPAPRRFRAVNLLEELDLAGEYYLDRGAGLLYFWPPGPLEGARVILSQLGDPIVDLKDASHLALRGFTFDSTVGAALRMSGGEGNILLGCTIRNTGLEGANISGGKNHTVQSCDIYDTGTGGLHMNGGDRKTLTPSGHRIENNHIYQVSRRMRTHAYNLHIEGVGVQVLHNLIHDAPHQAIGAGGNDHLFDLNEIHHVGMASDDSGAFYMGRNPSDRGTVLRHNYWHHLGSTMAHGSCAIYFDDGDGGQTVYGNVFYKAAGGSFGAVFNHGGHGNIVTNNIFIQCSRAMGAAPWSPAMWQEWLDGDLWKRRLREEVDITKPPFTERYADLEGFYDSAKRLRLNHAERNIAYQCGSFSAGNWNMKDCISLTLDPGFVDVEAGNFALRDDAAILKELPGWTPIPFDQMGLYLDEFRTSLPQRPQE